MMPFIILKAEACHVDRNPVYSQLVYQNNLVPWAAKPQDYCSLGLGEGQN